MDKKAQQRLIHFLSKRVASLTNPRELGAPLHGPKLGRFWKYRVGDYRVICDIQDQPLKVLVVRISHRKDIYR